jgi:hypothetical protein
MFLGTCEGCGNSLTRSYIISNIVVADIDGSEGENGGGLQREGRNQAGSGEALLGFGGDGEEALGAEEPDGGFEAKIPILRA